jgi:hypothetical protein
MARAVLKSVRNGHLFLQPTRSCSFAGSLLLQHAILHDDFIVDFHQDASAFVPESCFAVAVARARAGDHVWQAQLVASETDIDELILCLELCHHRLPVRAAKAEPFLLSFA